MLFSRKLHILSRVVDDKRPAHRLFESTRKDGMCVAQGTGSLIGILCK